MNQPNPIPRAIWLALLASPIAVQAQLGAFNATYSFADVSTSSGVSDPTPPPTATGLSFGVFRAHGVAANPGAAGRFAFSGWSTSAGFDPNRYFEVTLTPESGFYADLSQISFGVRRSGTGPRDFAVRSSLDSYFANVGTASVTSPEISVAADAFHFVNDIAPSANIAGNSLQLPSAFQTLTESVTFRIYAANPESTSGSFTVDEVTFTGSTSVVPEPSEYAAVTGLTLVVAAAWNRKRRALRSQ